LSYAVIENNAGNFLISGVSASFPNTEGGNKTAPIIGNTANDFWWFTLSLMGKKSFGI
jgi:hypothetical protein